MSGNVLSRLRIPSDSYLLPILVTTSFAVLTSVASLTSGVPVIFQNIYYFPIILACYRYPRRGFIFSVYLVLAYLLLTVVLTAANPGLTLQALVQVIGFVGVAAVVSLLSRKLLVEEEKYRNVVNDQTEFICRTFPDGSFLFANPAFLDYYGISGVDITKTRFRPDIPPEDATTLQRHLASLSPGRPVGKIEHRVILPGGRLRWQSWTNHGTFDEKGRLLEILSVGRDITEQKQAEEARILSESRFRELFRTMSSGVIVYQPQASTTQFLVTDINLAAERIDHVNRSQVIGREMGDVFLGLEESGIREVIQRVAQTGKSEQIPLRLYEGGEQRGWREYAISRLPSGEVVAVFDDVTARMRAEEAVRENERRFRELADFLPQTVFEIGSDLRLTFLNRTGSDLFGISPDEVAAGVHILDLLSPPERERALQAVLAVMGDEPVIAGVYNPRQGTEYLAVRRDGTVFPTLITMSPVHREHRVAGLRGVMVNISDMKRTEEKLIQLSQFRKSVIDDAATWINVMDTSMRVSIWNKAAEGISGYSQEEVRAIQDIWQILLPDREYRALIMARINRELLTTGKVENLETNIRCKNGDEKVLLWNIRVMTGARGEPLASIAMAREITHQYQLEEEKKRALEQINRNIEQLAILNDNIRNPLQRIVGYADLYGDTEFTGKILESAEEIDQIINQLDQGWLESQKISKYLRRHYGNETPDYS